MEGEGSEGPSPAHMGVAVGPAVSGRCDGRVRFGPADEMARGRLVAAADMAERCSSALNA